MTNDILFAAICAIIGTFILIIKIYRFLPKSIKGIAYPHSHPIFGHIPYMIKNIDKLYDSDVEQIKKFGPTYQLIFPGKNNVRTCDPKNIKHILCDNFDNYVKFLPGDVSFVEELLGGGIFAADGLEAKNQRKAASHMFSTRLLREYAEGSFLNHGLVLSGVLMKHLTKNTNTMIDMQDYFFRFTMDSFSQIAFGNNLDSLNANSQPAFAFAFDRIQELVIMRHIYPGFVWRTQRLFQNSREIEIKKCQKIMHQYVDGVIDECEKNIFDRKDEKKRSDIISLNIVQADKEDRMIVRSELRDIVINFMLAGRDTTAVLLSWALVEFCRNPGWVELQWS